MYHITIIDYRPGQKLIQTFIKDKPEFVEWCEGMDKMNEQFKIYSFVQIYIKRVGH